MTYAKALQVLEQHNKWRRDNLGRYEMVSPQTLGEAIDVIVKEGKKHIKQSVKTKD